MTDAATAVDPGGQSPKVGVISRDDERYAQLPPAPAEPGLTSDEAAKLLIEHGRNRLVPEEGRHGPLAWILKPFSDPMALLLLVAAPTYILIGDAIDAIVTLIALVPIIAVGLVLEVKAERALEQLRKLTAPTITVWRDAEYTVIPAEDLVPGDLLVVQEGDVIPADADLLHVGQMMVDESALTGESLPVAKSIGEEDGALFAGTTVLSGRGIARVAVTGTATRYGKIGSLVAKIKQQPTPLQRLVTDLVRTLGIVAAVFCTAVVAVELLRGEGLGAAVIAGVSLAIAAIPEEFPMVYTLYLALGAWRLARERALVRRLSGVETLGSTTVICSDKTGTLTLGQVEVAALAAPSGATADGDKLEPDAHAILRAAVLASEPRPFDPLEQAIMRFARSKGVDPDGLQDGVLASDYAFEPHHKYMSHVWKRDGRHMIAAKGSIEGILHLSHATPDQRAAAQHANHSFASDGMRVLAVAAGELDGTTGDRAHDEEALHFLGLVAFADPVRPGVTEALAQCRDAGIRVVMITGDHPLTAHAVAEHLGLPHSGADGMDVVATGADLDEADDAKLREIVGEANIFARTRPEQKHRLVEALKALGHVVAMTGDGINDAPALREADIGIAMGKRGTEVARESATLVLLDDNFSTIVGAVRNGRRIFDNLQKAFAYLVAFHPPLLIAAFLAPMFGQPLLLLPIHLILLELVVHPTVALVFENDPPAPDLMARPPRTPGSGLLSRQLLSPLLLGLTVSAAVVAAYGIALGNGMPTDQARGLAWAILLVSEALLVLAVRSKGPVWTTSLVANNLVIPLVSLTIVALLLTLYVPPLATLFKVAPFPVADWFVVVALALVASFWSEPLKPLKVWRRVVVHA